MDCCASVYIFCFTSVHTYTYIRAYIHMHASTRRHTCMHTCTHAHERKEHVRVLVCMCLVYIHIQPRTHTHTHTHPCIHTCVDRKSTSCHAASKPVISRQLCLATREAEDLWHDVAHLSRLHAGFYQGCVKSSSTGWRIPFPLPGHSHTPRTP